LNIAVAAETKIVIVAAGVGQGQRYRTSGAVGQIDYRCCAVINENLIKYQHNHNEAVFIIHRSVSFNYNCRGRLNYSIFI